MTEEDVKLRYITPAIRDTAGWKPEQIHMEAFAPGRIIVRGRKTMRGKEGKADYLLTMSNSGRALAVVEAKDLNHDLGAGMQQALRYATQLDAPFAYSSNGTGFLEHDLLTGLERELPLDQFPTEKQLWDRYVKAKNLGSTAQNVVRQPYYFDPFTKKEPRYYQRIAIDRTLEAVAQGQKRILLVMATGTGKTFTAFQIVWRLLEAGAVKRVLYLADRNVLIDQTLAGDFRPFGNRMIKVQNKHLDSAYEVYMSLYHQVSGEEGEEPFRQFQPDFFDLIVVDECHRGSARQDSRWRKVLDYFSSAVHIGLTATPKETTEVSNQTYFGEPIYTYSLREGISDGFLAPYKVLRVGLDVDLYGWRPEEGQTDIDGDLVEDREYNVKDFDRNIIIDERTSIVAKYVAAWLKKNGTDSKTIVFCQDIDHAERMRQALSNECLEEIIKDYRYVMRITGDDEEGKSQLDNFTDADSLYPTVVTTSQLLRTGVDVKTLKLVVLESTIDSMTEFKQIIGRGTRLDEEHGKSFFTIMDFRGSTRLFADPDFDGMPTVITEVPEGSELPDPDENGANESVPDSDGGFDTDDFPWPDSERETEVDRDPDESRKKKIRVRGIEVRLLDERVQYIDPITGKLMTESITDFSRRNVLGQYATLEDFIKAWNDAERKQVLIEELADHGVMIDALREQAGRTAEQMDDFDLIVHVAYDRPPLTRSERANNVKKTGYLHAYSQQCRQVLEALLDKYATMGVSEIEDLRILDNDPFIKIGSPTKIVKLFGGKLDYEKALDGLINLIYSA